MKVRNKNKKKRDLILLVIIMLLLITILIVSIKKLTGDIIVQNLKISSNKSCIESNGALNYSVKGTCRDKNQILTDTCMNSKSVIEYYCNSDKNRCINIVAFCQYGCKDGACMKKIS